MAKRGGVWAWGETRGLAAGLLAASFVLFAAPALMADDQRALPSRTMISAQLTALFGVVAGCAIVATAFYPCRALFRFAHAQSQRTAGSSWRKTFHTAEYTDEGRTFLAGSLKDFRNSVCCLFLAAGAISGLNRQ